MLHLLMAFMVVLISCMGRAVRWLGGWWTDLGLGLGLEDEDLERKKTTKRLWPLDREQAHEL